MKLEAQDVAQGELVYDVGPQQGDVEGMVLRVALEGLQDDVKDSVGVKVKATWEEEKQTFVII